MAFRAPTAIAAVILAALAMLSPARAATLPPTANASATQDPCPPQATGAVCGHVDVPLDRHNPAAGIIPIAFELYRHTRPGPAQSAIIVNFGGPGASTTDMRWVLPYWVGPAMDRHDVLLIDDRGRGSSGAIDCPDLQHATGPLRKITAACAAQLGPRAVDYSTADIAADDEAVRAALGYQAVDFAGTSYGGIDASAYATRFPGHLRSLLLDTPVGVPDLDPIAAAASRTRRDVALVGLLCSRSSTCGHSAREAVARVRWLARQVRRHPVWGTGRDADGIAHHVKIGATYLLVHILDSTGGPFLIPGEIPAAADALARGDAVPLLRLAAENDLTIPGDAGDPAQFSQGAFAATFCVDSPWPWSPDASRRERQAEWARAVRRTPDALFAPFRAEEGLFSVFGQSDFCLPWPQTGTRPPVAPGASYPRVPTLVLQGELDALGFVPQTARLFPGARLIKVVGAGHNTFSSDPCGRDLAVQFLETLKVTDARCASRTPMNYPGVRAFPRFTADSPSATATRGNRSSRISLRIARVAADAVVDVLKRGFLSNSGNGPGLRGGSFHTNYRNGNTTLRSIRWTDDLAVSGRLHWNPNSGALRASLRIHGPRRHHGFLHMKGGWLIAGAARSIQITGTIDSEHISARVPST
jgi:pimeloyl-ACP methyl ester carboxylesterase